MDRRSSTRSFSEYRTVGEAARFLGVSPATLRNWDRTGKLKPRRHPQNGYRIYLHEDLEAVLRSAESSASTDDSFAPPVDWSTMGDSEHFVQFYDDDDFLVDSVTGFAGAALDEGQGSLVIATAAHRSAILCRLAESGVDCSDAAATGRLVMLDAAETLSDFMIDGVPDPRRFTDSVGKVVAKLAGKGRRVHAFGEMVSLLWHNGDRTAAIRLEELWTELGKRHRFALFCAYPMNGFGDERDAVSFEQVCNCHSRVVPVESYAAINDPQERLREITFLQQKAQALEAEIVHRNEVETVLSRRERELADFFENATEGLHKVGPEGTILWANKAECALLGYALDEYVGRSITAFHADAQVIDEILQMLRRGETLENQPARLRCKDGAIKHVLINSSACFEDGKFAYTRCFTRDVTSLWQAEQALREADRRKDEFLATLAHELRNPLAPIRNALEMLRLKGNQAAVTADVRGILERQVRQMSRLVDDLLDVNRITRGKIELRKERVDLATIVQTAMETSRSLIDSRGHNLTVILPPTPIPVNVDPTRMAQVLANLLNNSAKYTERGGTIVLEAKPCGREVYIAVRDNGIGISPDALAYVFDMFRQVDRSLEKSQGGLGVGLTLVRRLVELHGGSVNARSEGPGQGSEFTVRLPVAEGELPRSEVVKHVSPTVVPKFRVLIVDDNRDAADLMSALMRLKGHETRTARDGQEAVDSVPEFRPDIILMDVGMPRLNGHDATRRIRELPGGKDIFIIALTGWGQPEDVQKSAAAGCSAHLVKPVDFAALDRLLALRTNQVGCVKLAQVQGASAQAAVGAGNTL